MGYDVISTKTRECGCVTEDFSHDSFDYSYTTTTKCAAHSELEKLDRIKREKESQQKRSVYETFLKDLAALKDRKDERLYKIIPNADRRKTFLKLNSELKQLLNLHKRGNIWWCNSIAFDMYKAKREQNKDIINFFY